MTARGADMLLRRLQANPPGVDAIMHEVIAHRAWKDVGYELLSTALLKYELNRVPFTVSVREPVIGYLVADERLRLNELGGLLRTRRHIRRWEPDEDAYALRCDKFTAQQAVILGRPYAETIARRKILKTGSAQ